MLPLLLMVGAALVLGYFFWDASLDAVRRTLEGYELVDRVIAWLEAAGLAGLKGALAPLIVVFIATPAIVIVALLVVASLMTPAMVSLVAERRFPTLEKRRGGSLLAGLAAGLLATVVAVIALVVSLPLWLVPPLALVLPPLIWGWLTYRVLSYDVLAEHASREERRELMREHRPTLLAIGVLTGYLGAAPSVVWASGVLFVALAPVLVPIAIWIYTLVFAFAALWFAHHALAALAALRERNAVLPPLPTPPGAPPATIIEALPPP